jgi:ribonuclease I
VQVLACTWSNGVCEAWKQKNDEIMQKLLRRAEGDDAVIVVD